MTNKKETKVVCPVCGSEFEIDAHEHQVNNAIAIGKDSGLGTVYLPVSKRGEALKVAGVDTSNYFSIQLPTGGEQLMKMNANGIPVAVGKDDPIMAAIVKQGTVPNRNLFRRWVMSQVFHGLTNPGGFATWLKWHGYDYQWKMLIEELRVQEKLYGKDMENYRERNRWFNKKLCVTMAEDYIAQLRKDASKRPIHHCKGVPYITIKRNNYFVSDIEKKLVWPLEVLSENIARASTPKDLYYAVKYFWKRASVGGNYYDQCAAWKDAYKGMGAYATMQNLIRFHNCKFPKYNSFYCKSLSDLNMLDNAAFAYSDGSGWRLFGLMKQLIQENGIDIKAKMMDWAFAKKTR